MAEKLETERIPIAVTFVDGVEVHRAYDSVLEAFLTNPANQEALGRLADEVRAKLEEQRAAGDQ